MPIAGSASGSSGHDVAKRFPNSEAVNQALRSLARIQGRRRGRGSAALIARAAEPGVVQGPSLPIGPYRRPPPKCEPRLAAGLGATFPTRPAAAVQRVNFAVSEVLLSEVLLKLLFIRLKR